MPRDRQRPGPRLERKPIYTTTELARAARMKRRRDGYPDGTRMARMLRRAGVPIGVGRPGTVLLAHLHRHVPDLLKSLVLAEPDEDDEGRAA